MLCSTLRRAAVGQGPCAKCSVRANSLILDTKPRSGTDRPLRTRVRKSRPGLLPTRTFAGLPNPTFSCQSAVSCPFSDDFSARSPPNRWRAENPPEKARASCARIPKGRGSCVRIPQERGLTMAETLALGGEGASELPFCQRGRRRIGKARRADLARPCPFELRFAAPPVVLPAGAIGGTPPSTDPDPMGSSGGGDRHQVTLRRGADRPSRTALCPCPREGSDALPAGARFRGGRGLPPGACAAKARPARASHRSSPARFPSRSCGHAMALPLPAHLFRRLLPHLLCFSLGYFRCEPCQTLVSFLG